MKAVVTCVCVAILTCWPVPMALEANGCASSFHKFLLTTKAGYLENVFKLLENAERDI